MKDYQDKYSIQVWRENHDLGDTPQVTILYVVLGSCSLHIQDQGIPSVSYTHLTLPTTSRV